MAAIFLMLKDHAQAALAAVAMLLIGSVLLAQHLEIRHYASAASRCRDESIALESANRRLVAAMETQNQAVAALKAEADARKARGDRARALGRAVANRHEAQARGILLQTRRSGDCDAMKKLLKEFRPQEAEPFSP